MRRGLDKLTQEEREHLLSPTLLDFIQLEPALDFDMTGRRIAVASDPHVPLFSVEDMNRLIERSRAEGIDTLLMAGDFWNMNALARFEPGMGQSDQGKGGELETEWRMGRVVMDKLLDTFQEIIVLFGNHDWRFARKLGYTIQFKAAMEMLFTGLDTGRLRFTNLDHAYVRTALHDWYIAHPESYTKIPLRNARELADIHDMSVMTAHSHHMAWGYAKNGRHMVVELGGLFDRSKTAYLQRTTTYPVWVNGWVWLDENGLLHLEARGLTY